MKCIIIMVAGIRERNWESTLESLYTWNDTAFCKHNENILRCILLTLRQALKLRIFQNRIKTEL